MLVRNYGDKREKQCCSGSHKQRKTLFKDHMVRLKIISLYIYKDLTYDLRSNASRDHYHEDGNLVPSPRGGFSFEAALNLSLVSLFLSAIRPVASDCRPVASDCRPVASDCRPVASGTLSGRSTKALKFKCKLL